MLKRRLFLSAVKVAKKHRGIWSDSQAILWLG